MHYGIQPLKSSYHIFTDLLNFLLVIGKKLLFKQKKRQKKKSIPPNGGTDKIGILPKI